MSNIIIDQDFPYDLIHRGAKDASRHNKRVDDALRKQLKDVIARQDIITGDRNKKVKVRLKYLDQYRFIHSRDKIDVVGRDEFDDFEEGEILYKPEDGTASKSGNEDGDEVYEAEYTIEELTNILLQELQLPDLDENKKNEIVSDVVEWNDINKNSGIRSLIDKKKTLLANILRKSKLRKQKAPIINDDMRFKSYNIVQEKYSNAVIFLCMDRSGCHTAGHLIEVEHGFKRIEDVGIGDKVASVNIHTGEKCLKPVVNTFKFKSSSVLRLITEDTILECTKNHRYFVFSNGEIIEKLAKDIQIGDDLIYSLKTLPNNGLSDIGDFERYYIAGYALGDGHIMDTRQRKGGSASLIITDENISRLKFLFGCCERAFKKIPIITTNYRNRIHINSCDVVDFILKLNPHSAEKSNKRRLSSKVLCHQPLLLGQYLKGLFDAEGWVGHHSVAMLSSSLNMVKDIKCALSKFGIRARIHRINSKDRYIGNNFLRASEFWQLTINSKDCLAFEKEIGFNCESKRHKLKELVQKQLKMNNAMRSKYISLVNLYDMSSSDGRMRSGMYDVSRKTNCFSRTSLNTILNHKDTLTHERNSVQNVLNNGLVISKVKTVEQVSGVLEVYDLEVKDLHNYLVNGTLSHNSMWEEKIYAVKVLYFWIVQFLRRRYDNVVIKFIAHDVTARELEEKEFFTISDSGGTKVSSAYELCRETIKYNYPASRWNIYCFHASDGDSWGDEVECIKIVNEITQLGAKLFAYSEIQLEDYTKPSTLLSLFRDAMESNKQILVSEIKSMDGILNTIRKFLRHSVRQSI